MRAVCGSWQRNTSLVDYSKVVYSVKNEVSPECPLDSLPMLNITLQWVLDVFDREPGSPSLREFWEELEIGDVPFVFVSRPRRAIHIDTQTHPFKAEGVLSETFEVGFSIQKSC